MVDGDGVIQIEFAAMLNVRDSSGWLPSIWVNGYQRGHRYASTGYEREEAEQMAHEEAKEYAAKFLGDWSISICQRGADANRRD